MTAFPGILPRGTIVDVGNHKAEILSTPAETGDRYRLRVTAEPGGGPGIDGDGPHIHPILVETFVCRSGTMRARLGKELVDIGPGQDLEVPPGTVHGFVNAGDEPLVVETDVIFQGSGYQPDADIMGFLAIYERLRDLPNINKRTGEPPVLQMIVLCDAYRRGYTLPGFTGALIRPLAMVGRLRGYRAGMPGDQATRSAEHR
jgi:mannose-6-phosphate isomerase-like protein (cupin superfamily)